MSRIGIVVPDPRLSWGKVGKVYGRRDDMEKRIQKGGNTMR